MMDEMLFEQRMGADRPIQCAKPNFRRQEECYAETEGLRKTVDVIAKERAED
jgi:hypothetical protein